MMKSIAAAAVLLLVIFLPAISGCGRPGGDAGAAGPSDRASRSETRGDSQLAIPAVQVSARAVEERSFEAVVTAPGLWRSAGRIIVSAPFSGIVDSLSVRPGDRVLQGEVLCRLVTRESRAALRGAEIMARQAQDDAARDEATRALDLARREMVRVAIPAPRAGSVTDVSVQPGSEISESTEILAIQTPDAVVFEARIDPSDASRIRDGQRAIVVDHGRAESREAIVQRILPVAGMSDQTTLVWLAPRVAASAPPPEIDRFGTATITTGGARRAPAIPDPAVIQDDLTGQTRVALVDERHRALWTSVTLGAGADGWRELKAPFIAPGTLVIIQGQRGLPDSTRVEPAS